MRRQPFLPYALILSRQDIGTLAAHDREVCTSFPIPIILREQLEENMVSQESGLLELQGVHFFMWFNEKLLDEEWEFADPGEGIEDRVVKAFLLEELEAALATLSGEERMLVEELFYLEKTEREVCDALHMAKTTLNRRKQAILKKLRERMQEG